MDTVADGRMHEQYSVERVETTFYCLPSEILAEVIVNLDGKDRENLGCLNDRLEQLEQLAGHRRFRIIEFQSSGPYLIKTQVNGTTHKFGYLLPLEHFATFFHRASAERVEIKGPSLKQHSGKLHLILRTVKFRTLDIEINNEESFKFLMDLLRHFTSIKEVTIRWNIDGVKMEKSQLFKLPRMNRYSIISVDNKGFLNDDVLLGVIGTSTGSINLYSPEPNISAEGLAEAFKMIYTDRNQRAVFCSALRAEVAFFADRLDLSRFTKTENSVVHTASGATLSFNDSVLEANSYCIKMHNFSSEFSNLGNNH